MRKDHTGQLGDDKTVWGFGEPDKKGDYGWKSCSLPSCEKPVDSWMTEPKYRYEKHVDGTHHHYM